MLALAAWLVVTAIGLTGAVASVNSLRFRHRVANEARAMWSTVAPARPSDPSRLASLPDPVRRYLGRALHRSDAVQCLRLRHGGVFRTSLDGKWLPIRGEQYFSADPPAFVWWGRVRAAPGLWIDARDRSVAGAGAMLVSMESSFTLADRTGPELDQGALLRLLGELLWFPTVLLDERYVRWEAVDDRRSRATLRVNGLEVSAVFEFDVHDLPVAFRADRFRDVGHGEALLTPFVGVPDDYREVAGLLVPHRMVACWEIDGQRRSYARFDVESLEYDRPQPF